MTHRRLTHERTRVSLHTLVWILTLAPTLPLDGCYYIDHEAGLAGFLGGYSAGCRPADVLLPGPRARALTWCRRRRRHKLRLTLTLSLSLRLSCSFSLSLSLRLYWPLGLLESSYPLS